tara:strand:- start:1339 stop:1905 length:567 start_codon:yes stop_codon:yes gene_type:complete
MAYTKDDFLRDLAIYSAGGIIGVSGTRKMVEYAAKKGIQLAGIGVARTAAAAPAVGRAALANPALTGGLLGAAALETQMGQDLLAAAEERGRQDRVRLERAQQDAIFGTQERIKRATKRKTNKFSKAVGAGVKAVKASTFQGAKGKLSNPKKTFSAVTKVASKIKAGKKVSRKGVTGRIARAVRGIYR